MRVRHEVRLPGILIDPAGGKSRVVTLDLRGKQPWVGVGDPRLDDE